MATKDYDFILVGAGTAACLIASRLSQRLPNQRILVLEAGQHIRDDPKVQTPGLSARLQSDPTYDWQYVTAPEPGLNGRKVKHPRGKLVGGTSAINSHSVVFPNREWQDRIAEELLAGVEGSEEWTAKGMEECYRRWQAEGSRSEQQGVSDDAAGPPLDRVQTSYPRKMDFLQTQWVKVFEELGHGEDPTGFVASSAGAVTVTNAVDSSKGERSHAGTAFMDPALQRGNVTLKTGVYVDKIVFDELPTAAGKLHAKGVHFTSQGASQTLTAREIILCAGVFESPALLERSGIGAPDVLAAASIPLLYALPGVGENLQDHLNCGLSFETQPHIPTHDAALHDAAERAAAAAEYALHRTGRLAEGSAHSFAFTPLQILESPAETRDLVDQVAQVLEQERDPSLRAQYSLIQKAVESPVEATGTTFMLRMQRHRDAESLPKDTPPFVEGKYVTVVAMLAHPFSRGSCHIPPSSPSPSATPATPLIKFNYLTHPLDTFLLSAHILHISRLFALPSLSALAKPNGRLLPRTFPFPVTSLADAARILPQNCATNYHPCGTCALMREDLRGVVDAGLRVYGTANVRVCDASVLPVIPRGNVLSAVYGFAEKVVEMVCREEEGVRGEEGV